MYKEELEKRQTIAGYNQVEFSYDEVKEIGPKESADVTQEENEESDDTPFIPGENLNLPTDMEYPNTVKLNQIIEKTAKFISSQGPQMEILLKTKQSSNPQFEFLNHNGQYNAYYKHILSMIKNNTYVWQNSKINENSMDDNSNTNDSKYENEEVATTSTIIIPKMQFKPSADCAYTQLISKITKAPISELERKQEEEEKRKQIVTNSDPSKIIGGSLSLVASYNSESETDHEEDEAEEYKGPIPPSEIQIVIDKTATYVAKNGPEFEQKLIFKQDPRFQFLHENNEYNLYYKMKVKSFQPCNSINIVPQTASSTKVIEAPKKVEIVLPKPPPAPVSFSIKTKEERPPLKSTSMANSDDESKENCHNIPQTPSPPRITTSIEEELERQVDIIATEREEKLAKERLNDKLLNAARAKMGMLPKEKMLQIERKKKAMMFINQIKGSNGSSNGGSKREDDVINLTQCGEDSNDSASVKSSTMSEKSRSRKNSSSRSSRSTSRSRSRSSSSRSSDSSPKRKRSKKKSHRKRKYRRSRSRSRSPGRYKHSKRW
ncbi:protein suppressor of white apricot-like isoform X2 [Chironomus tepperi]